MILHFAMAFFSLFLFLRLSFGEESKFGSYVIRGEILDDV